MTILADFEVVHYAKCLGMIDPFTSQKIRQVDDRRILSAHLEPYGYTITLQSAKKSIPYYGVVDMLKPPSEDVVFEDVRIENDGGESWFVMSPGDFVIGVTAEYFKMPPNVGGLPVGKSTLARWGIADISTALEPGWEGNLMIELANVGKYHVKIPLYQGISQIVFWQGEPPRHHYGHNPNPRYQGQRGFTMGTG